MSYPDFHHVASKDKNIVTKLNLLSKIYTDNILFWEWRYVTGHIYDVCRPDSDRQELKAFIGIIVLSCFFVPD